MKMKLFAGLATGLIVLGVVGSVTANTITYTEVYNPGSDILLSNTDATPLAWTFDITDNAGWLIPGQVFSNGTITLTLAVDGGSGDGGEKADFVFDGGSGSPKAGINGAPWDRSFIVDYSQFSDGLISATLTATKGDFYFRSAQLHVTSNFTPQSPPGNPIPEPATMLLFGTGLAGFAAIARRKRS